MAAVKVMRLGLSDNETQRLAVIVDFVSESSEGVDRRVLSRNALYAQNLRMPVFSV